MMNAPCLRESEEPTMWNNIALTRRLWLIVAAYWAALLVVIGVSGWGLQSARDSLNYVHDVRMDNSTKLAKMAELLTANRMLVLLSFQHDPAGSLVGVHDHPVTAHLEDIAKNRAEITKMWETYKAIPKSEEEARIANEAEAKRSTWLVKLGQAVAAIKAGDYSATTMANYLAASRTEGAQAVQAMDELRGYQAKQADMATQAAGERYQTSLIVFTLAILLGALPATLLTLMLLSRMRSGFKLANDHAAAIASGDLSSAVPSSGGDEIGQLLAQMALMRDNLHRLIGQVRFGAESIASATSEVASGTLDLSNRTEQQASTLEETAAASEQLASTVRQNADSAQQANQLASSASNVAVQGGTVVSQVVTTMEAINHSSRKIVDIISVIDGIAFQTNILALNAAVEAARAGEQGRGFAVVAAEVRSLAQRSAEAAKEIKTLISDSVEKVGVGTDQVAKAGHTMEEIVTSIRKVADIVGEIASASREQSTGIGQINQAVTQLDSVTQQNAALVEQASAAAGSLQEQARQLADVANSFQLSASHVGAPRLAPAPTRARAPAPAPAAPRKLSTPPAPTRLSAPAKQLAASSAPRPAAATPPAPKPAPAPAPAPSGGNDEWESF